MTARERRVVLRVDVQQPPDPFRLRAAIEARVAGRAWPAGPERAIAEAVAEVVANRTHRTEAS
jgi:hypothetical protein